MNDVAMSNVPGMPVWGMVEGSAAQKAGVKVGDIIISVDGKPTPDVKSYWEACKERGSVVTIEVYRAGRIITLSMNIDNKAKVS